MCGIVGILSEQPHSIRSNTLHMLKRLEYRGYDSVGVATLEGDIQKDAGQVDPFVATITDYETCGSIAHTRWATHGGVSRVNSHPHSDATGEFMIVHNGIIENADELQAMVPGCCPLSETDSEVIAAFFRHRVVEDGLSMEEAIQDFFRVTEGTYAVLLMRKGDERMYALKHNSPLALARVGGLAGGAFVLASDISAFSDETREAYFFDDMTYAIVAPDAFDVFGADGGAHAMAPHRFEWSSEQATLEEHPHFMIKEILEQPQTALRLLESFRTIQSEPLTAFAAHMKRARRIVFLSCGTSYHASLIGAFMLNQLNYEAHTVIASEFENFILVDASTFVIAISQSGETMDVILPLKQIIDDCAGLGSIVNVPHSTIQRLSNVSLDLLAGQEICVASTKAFTNQVIALMGLAERLGFDIDLSGIPGKISQTLEAIDPICRRLADELSNRNEIYVLGRGAAYPMAREIALKFKEIDYIHAEGMMAGELKHGTLALIEDGTPVICLIPGSDRAMLSSRREVEARGARTIVVSNTGEGEVNVPPSGNAEFAIYACLFGHLLSYYIGVARDLPIDKPRNLAKSVTVG